MHITDEVYRDLLGMTMTEVYILQFLLNYSEPVLRYNVLEDINESLPQDLRLSPTKFYYSLSKLEKNNYIELREGKRKKSAMVIPRPKIRELFRNLLGGFALATIDMGREVTHLIHKFFQENNIQRGKRTLTVAEEHIDPHKLSAIGLQTKKLFILADDEQFEKFRNRNSDIDILQSRFYDGRIREADNYFDISICITDQITQQLFNELVRVTEGVVVVGFIDNVEPPTHVLAESLLRPFIQTTNTLESTIELFESTGIEPNVFRYRGFVLVWARIYQSKNNG